MRKVLTSTAVGQSKKTFRSMKASRTLLVIVGAQLIIGCMPAKPTAERVFEDSQKSVVKVYSLHDQGEPGRSGTGFVVQLEGQPIKILTNKHLTENASVVVVETATDIWVTEKWTESPTLDAALLDIPANKTLAPLEVGTASQAKPGQEIFVVGYPLGDNISIQAGHISALGMGDLVFNAPFSQGASGSPLLDSSGLVIGLCHSYIREAQNHNMATPLDLLNSISTWKIKTGTPDSEVLDYLEKVSSIKKVLNQHLEQWAQVAHDMPIWHVWVGRSMLTRKPLAEALENLFLAIHSVRWGQISDPTMRVSNQLEATLLGQKTQALLTSWQSHQQNLEHLGNKKPHPLPSPEYYEFQQLVESSQALSIQLRDHLAQPLDQPPPDITSLTLALQKYLELENKCLALGLP